MGYPKRLLSEGESIVREFRPHWRLLVIPAAWALLFVAAIVATWLLAPEEPIFDWVITAAGRVGTARQAQSSLRSAAVASCVLRQIRCMRFPRPVGGSVQVRYPFLFRARSF